MRQTLTAVVALCACSTVADAQQKPRTDVYPARPVRLVVANTAGSAPDVVARLVGEKLAQAWGQQIVVDNRPGASGLIAAEVVAKAPPDGYTLWLATMSHLISTLQAQRLQLTKEFAPVSQIATTPFIIVVDSSLPVKTLAEWIAYAKARPGQLLYGSDGQWSSGHLCMESFNALTGIRLDHVPYKGTGSIMQDLAGGRIQAYCPAAPALPSIVQTGKVRALGVTYKRPTKLAPGIPPIADTLPNFELLGWYGVLAPLNTPPRLVAKISGDLAHALKDAQLQEQLVKIGAEAAGSTAEDFSGFLKRETERWGKLLR
jgi:tripartite-type tricarboxylate transporter receptor subunit TctC